MGVLDTILIKELITAPATVNSNITFDFVDISYKEAEFSIQLNYNGGSSVNMVLYLEVSNDASNWSRITDSEQTITEDSGSHVWDLLATGVTYMRVGIEVTDGSIDANRLMFHMKRRH